MPWFKNFLIGKQPKVTLIRLVVLIIVSLVIFHYIIIPVKISGRSMEPNYYDGQYIFVNRLSYWRAAPGRGQVVGIRLTGYRLMYLKRIVGLPGETIQIKAGQVVINGRELEELYTTLNREPWELPPAALGADEYFVIGDNRDTDERQHVFGRVDRKYIAGQSLW